MLVKRPSLLRFAIAVITPAVALLLTLWAGPLFEKESFLLFVAAVVISAWYGGLIPGLLAALLSALAGVYFLLPPLYSFSIAGAADAVRLAVFALVAVLISSITSALGRSERTLREQREYLQVTLGSIGDAVITADAQGRVTFINAVAEGLTGWKAGEAVGRPLEEVFHIVQEETRQPAENPVDRVLRQGTITGLANHTVIISKNGAETPIDDSAAPIRDSRGKLVGVVMVFRDIAGRRKSERQLRESRDQLDAILQGASDGISVQAPDGHLAFANDEAARVIGYPSAQALLDTPVSQIMSRFQVMDEAGRPFPLEQLPGRLALQGKPAPDVVLRFRLRESGEERWSIVNATPLKDPQGQVQFAVNIFHDITEIKRAEEQVRQQSEWLRVTLSSIGDAVIATDTHGAVTYINSVAETLTGWPQSEALGRDLGEVFHILTEETRQPAEDPVTRVLREGAVVGLANHTVLVAKDGSEKQIGDSAAPIRDAAGVVAGVVMVFRDVSARRRAEQRAAALYAVTRVLAETATLDEAARGILKAAGENLGWDWGALWVLNEEAGVLRPAATWHTPSAEFPAFEEATRQRAFRPGEGLPGRIWLQGQPAWIGDLEQDANFSREAGARTDGLHSGFGLPLLTAGRVLGAVEFFSRERRPPDPELLDELSALSGQLGQFVERKRAEEALRESEARKAAVLESALDAVITMDAQGRVQEFNPAAERIFGLSRQAAIGRALSDLVIPPEQREAHVRGLERNLLTGQSHVIGRRVEMTARRAGGEEFPAEVAIARIEREGGPIFTGYIRDLSEQKQAEATRSWLAAIVDSADEAVIGKSLDGVILTWNPCAEQIYGYRPEEAIGQPISILYPPERRGELADVTERVRRGERLEHYETVRVRKDGRRIDISVTIFPVRDSTGRVVGASGIERDITERKQAREQLVFQSNILENVRDSVTVIDGQGKVLYWNEGAEQLFGYTAAEILGRAPERLSPVGEQERFLVALRDVLSREDYVGEWEARRKDGTPVWVNLKTTAMSDARGGLRGYVGVAKDITERKREDETQRFLSEATALLAGSLDYQATLATIARLAVPHVADWASVAMREEDGSINTLAVAHVDPAKLELVHELQRRYPTDPDAPTGVPNVLRTGKSEMTSEITDEMLAQTIPNPELLRIVRDLGFSSAMTVPIVARGRSVGAISFAAAESGRHFGSADLAVAQSLANRAAIAVDNAELYRAEQEARRAAEQAADRTGRLQAVTAALSEAATPDQVATAVVEQGISALGARAGVVAVMSEDWTGLRVIRQQGYPPERFEPLPRISIGDHLPLTEAARDGQPVFLESMEGANTRYPEIANRWSPEDRAFVALPMVVEGRSVGALGLSFAEPRRFDAADREFMLALARQCGQALERARLFEAEQKARSQAEAAQDRLSFLAEASGVLSGSLDYEATLELLARLSVPALADWCIVDMLDSSDEIRQVAVAHAVPEKADLVRELRRRYPPENSHIIRRVLDTGESDLAAVITPDDLAARARDSEHLRLLRQVGITSHMVVPLRARGRMLGAISFVSSRQDRHYNREDLALAEELARRAAVAVDNARLYHESQEAVQARDQFFSIASHELKTPLTSLLGYAELLQRRMDKDGAASEKDRRAVDVIARQAERLNKLIAALLDLSRIQSGRLTLERAPVNLNHTLREVLENFQLTLTRHELEFRDSPEPLTVNGDELRLAQVFENLVQNAVKYSPGGGTVDVELRREGDMACIYVVDHGIGIPSAAIPQLFSRFYRAPNVDGKHIAGLGVGLSVVKEIVELHGGTIEVLSREGEGSTFIVRLPLQPDRQLTAAGRADPAPNTAASS